MLRTDSSEDSGGGRLDIESCSDSRGRKGTALSSRPRMAAKEKERLREGDRPDCRCSGGLRPTRRKRKREGFQIHLNISKSQ